MATMEDRLQQTTMEAASVLWNIFRAFLARLLFVVHSVVTVWQTATLTGADWLWGFALLILLVVFEGSHTIIMRAGDERKWFCTSVLLYVMATAPPIWMLERHLCDLRASQRTSNKEIRDEEELQVQMVEQIMLVVLIVGRWLLPKGDISSEQLTQILLAYLAIASDIVEFFDVFKEPVVYRSRPIQHVVMLAWTLSLLQFPFVITVSRARKMRVAITKNVYEYRSKAKGVWKMTHDVDLWAIILANCLQDIPFLMVRIYLMLLYRLSNYTMIFFTCKNALIILLQTYRAFVIINDRYICPRSQPPSVSEGASEADVVSQGRQRRRRRLPPRENRRARELEESERKALCDKRPERYERLEQGESKERLERSIERHKKGDHNRNYAPGRSKSHPRL